MGIFRFALTIISLSLSLLLFFTFPATNFGGIARIFEILYGRGFLERNARYARRMIKRRFDGPILSRDERFSGELSSSFVRNNIGNITYSSYWIRREGNRVKRKMLSRHELFIFHSRFLANNVTLFLTSVHFSNCSLCSTEIPSSFVSFALRVKKRREKKRRERERTGKNFKIVGLTGELGPVTGW